MHNTSIIGRMTILFFISLISKASRFETQKEQCNQKNINQRERYSHIYTLIKRRELGRERERGRERKRELYSLFCHLLPPFPTGPLSLPEFSEILCKQLKMVDFARVQKELQECSRDVERSGIKVSPKGDGSLARLIGTIPGPTGTPYEGGTFQIDIALPGSIQFPLSRIVLFFLFLLVFLVFFYV